MALAQTKAAALQLADEDILIPGAGQIEGSRPRIKIGSIPESAGGVDIAGRINGDAVADIG